MVAQEARRQYEADFDAEAQLLLGDVLAIVVERFGMVAQEAKVALSTAIASHVKRFRALAEAPPCRVIGGHLVYDAVALTKPIVLERALSRAFGEAIAQRTAGVVNTAAKGAGRRARGPAAGPNSGKGTTGAAALTACEVRDGGRRMATGPTLVSLHELSGHLFSPFPFVCRLSMPLCCCAQRRRHQAGR